MKCYQCPLGCGADRPEKAGACSVSTIKIAKFGLHHYEEPPISFSTGSGAVFFCGCPLKCVFCQNFDLSRNLRGKEITVEELADIFRRLEEMGADNINLVSATQYLSDIEAALKIYRPNIPIVWNTSGYETLETLERANEFVDIWLPDFKFMDPKLAKRYTGKENYPEFAAPAIRCMAKKPLVMREDGKMLSGCIIRHLILPLAAYDSIRIVRFVASLESEAYLSVMSQYTPFGDIEKFPELKRRITKREYNMVKEAAIESGMERLFLQDFSSASESYIPDWDF
ncbi:MAG: radical SAM protein [Clostridia bacterium]|nr:radical SAM protein [Clostridia bacterium]